MRRVAFILVLALPAVLPTPSVAQGSAVRNPWNAPLPDAMRQAIQSLQVALNTWDVEGMMGGVETLQEMPVSTEEERYLRAYWLGTAAFHAALALREDAPRESEPTAGFEQQATEALQIALELRPDERDAHAMLAILHGLAIRRNVLSVPFRWPDQRRHYRAAHDAPDDNPRVLYLEGVSRLKRARNRRDMEKAADLLERAAAGYAPAADATPDNLAPRWGYGPTLLFLGEASEALERYDKAAAWFQKAAQIMPRSDRARKGYERCRNQRHLMSP